MFGEPYPDLLLECAIDRRKVGSLTLLKIILSGRRRIFICSFIELVDKAQYISRRAPCSNVSASLCGLL